MTVLQPPGPRGLPLLGSLLEFRRDPLGFVTHGAREFGDVVRYTMGGRPVYLLVHPERIREMLVTRQHDFVKGRGLEWAKRYLGEGLLTSEGELHTRQRRLSQPAFHHKRLPGYARVMTEHALRRRERWRDGETLDLHAEMMALTLGIAGKTLFDADVEGEAAEIGASLATIIALFPRFSLPFASLLEKLPLKSNREFARARERLDATVYRIIGERRRDGRDRGDLLSMLMAARDEDDGAGMSDRQLRDEAITLFLAGHETTANMLAWTFHCLAQNEAAERRLHQELDEVLAGRAPGVEELPALAFVERVLAESMRLYPPAWILGRRALREVELGGYRIPQGAYVLASPYATQRDPRFFPDPLRFDPDRFTPEAKAARHKFAYFPFGGGARQCIGEGFAWMEGTLLLAVLAQRYRLRPAPDARVTPQPLITLRPRHGMKMRAEARA
jgi:cytochrome P450